MDRIGAIAARAPLELMEMLGKEEGGMDGKPEPSGEGKPGGGGGGIVSKIESKVDEDKGLFQNIGQIAKFIMKKISEGTFNESAF